jgi:ferritin
MLLSAAVNKALNEQVGREFASELQYVAIAAYFDCDSLPELAAHYYRQAEEERAHAMKIIKYIVDALGTVEIPAIPAPRATFESADEAVKLALDSEIEITRHVNELVGLARKEQDNLTETFLQWFVTEQLEEVSTADTLLNIVRRAGPQGLLFVEDYLARRGPVQESGGETGG